MHSESADKIEYMLNKVPPRAASLLVSEPFMLDPNFKRSVVLLCEHDDTDGTLGFILNQPDVLTLGDVLADLSEAPFRLFIGGPVGRDTLHFVHKCYDRLNSGIELANGVYWGGNFEALRLLIQRKEIGEDEIKFFMGYSGWSPGQLDQELQENTWMVSSSYHPDIVFENDEENLWREAIVNLGPKYAHVAKFPQNPMWN